MPAIRPAFLLPKFLPYSDDQNVRKLLLDRFCCEDENSKNEMKWHLMTWLFVSFEQYLCNVTKFSLSEDNTKS